jgi:hypothetical protein
MPEKKQRGQPKKDYTTKVASERVRTEWYDLVKKEMKDFIKKLKEKEDGV